MASGGIANVSAGDLATVLQQAVGALGKVIESKPATDRILAEMVRISGQALGAGAAGVWVTEIADKPELILEHQLAAASLMTEGEPAVGLVSGVRRCAREGKWVVVPAFFVEGEGADSPANPSPLELLFVPVKLHSAVAMVIVMAVPPPPASDGSLHRTYLNFLARMVGLIEQALGERHLNLLEKDRGTSGKLVRFADEIHKHLFLGQVTVDIANLARDVISADRVTVEAYPRPRKRVFAVSNVDEPNKRANLFQLQRLIFDYVKDRHVTVALDREAVKQLVSDPDLQDAATAYFAAADFEAFLAAPVKGDAPTDPVLGVIFAEYKSSETAQEQQSLMVDVARLSVSSLANSIEVESMPLTKFFHSCREMLRKPASPRRTLGLIIGGAALIAATVIGVIPVDFSIKGDCQIRPSAEMSIKAPMEGRILEVPVRAGEHVYTLAQKDALPPGTVKPLVVFDDSELKEKKAEINAQSLGDDAEFKAARSAGDMNKMSTLQQQLNREKSQMAELQKEIDQCVVYSPIEGNVLTENVERLQYSTVHKSDALMDVASFEDWQLVVDVPESEVATMHDALDKATRLAKENNTPDVGIPIEYILYPWPDERHSISAIGTATLLPASSQNKNTNVFRLQVKLNNQDLPDIRMSGVTGRAKIHVGHKPLATQWTRGAMRLLKMTLFF